MTLFADLKKAIGTEWTDYTEHEFVRKLGEGTLPLPVFQDYLVQDYHFLVQFARANALAAYKAATSPILKTRRAHCRLSCTKPNYTAD
ncbi:hypothetical protein [Corynebacterium stationis]|uniref:hypothetical protein n=1 Tax=Corynebacterium stationis TaxID=1705 RepID=UPI00242B7A54|nr:hypothetical protein [Corynebacterium stationis]